MARKKKEKSGSGVTNRKQYIYFNQLSFLLPVTNKATTSSIEPEREEATQDINNLVDAADERQEENAEEIDRPPLQRSYSRRKQQPQDEDKLMAYLIKKL